MQLPSTHSSPGLVHAAVSNEQLQWPTWLSQIGAVARLNKHDGVEPHWHTCEVWLYVSPNVREQVVSPSMSKIMYTYN